MKNIEVYNQELRERFLMDSSHQDMVNYLEQFFLDEKLSSIHWLHETNSKCQFKQFDPPDDRLELLRKFYQSIAGHDVIVLDAYVGKHLHLLEFVTGYLMINQMELEYDFKIISHSLASHYLYLVGGMLDIDWSIWITDTDIGGLNIELGRLIQTEAQKVGFKIGYFNEDTMQGRLLSPGSQSYNNFIKFRSDTEKAFPESLSEINKSPD